MQTPLDHWRDIQNDYLYPFQTRISSMTKFNCTSSSQVLPISLHMKPFQAHLAPRMQLFLQKPPGQWIRGAAPPFAHGGGLPRTLPLFAPQNDPHVCHAVLQLRWAKASWTCMEVYSPETGGPQKQMVFKGVPFWSWSTFRLYLPWLWINDVSRPRPRWLTMTSSLEFPKHGWELKNLAGSSRQRLTSRGQFWRSLVCESWGYGESLSAWSCCALLPCCNCRLHKCLESWASSSQLDSDSHKWSLGGKSRLRLVASTHIATIKLAWG